MDEFSVYADESLTVLEIIDKLDVQFQNYRNNKDAVIEELKTLLVNSTLTINELKVLEEYFTSKSIELNDLETSYLPELNFVKSQLADTKTEFQTVISGSTDGDEVINARGVGNLTLKDRLDGSDAQLAEKANTLTTYTKTEVDNKDSFKANKEQETWIIPTLINGWTPNTSLGTPQYRKNEFGEVIVRGGVNAGGTDGKIFTLPLGYRPPFTVYGIIRHNSSLIIYYSVDMYGSVVIPTSVQSWASFNIIFSI